MLPDEKIGNWNLYRRPSAATYGSNATSAAVGFAVRAAQFNKKRLTWPFASFDSRAA